MRHNDIKNFRPSLEFNQQFDLGNKHQKNTETLKITCIISAYETDI